MDSAITELMSAEYNANGVLSWFFEILRQPLSQRSKQQERYSRHLPRIPTTILFNYSRAQAWYTSHLVPQSGADQQATGSHTMMEASNSNNGVGAGTHEEFIRTFSSATEGRHSLTHNEEASLDINRIHTPDGTSPDHPRRRSASSPDRAQSPTSTYPEGISSTAHNHPSPTSPRIVVSSPHSHCEMVIEYRKRKTSDLTTHHIVSALCESYKDIASKLKEKEKERRKESNGQRGSKGMNQSGPKKASDALPNVSMAAIAKQLPRGRLCAQTIRKSNVASSASAEVDEEMGAGIGNGRLLAAKNAFRFIGKSVEAPTNAEAAVQFFDEHELGQLLFHGTLDYALLQRFDHPSQSHSHDPTYNTSLIADWQPNYCFVSRSQSLLPLTANQQSSQLRGDTSDPRVSEYKGPPGWNVQQALCNACNALAERVYLATNGIRIRKMSVVFKIDSRNNVILQWCQSAAVAKGPSTLTARDEVVSKLPVSAHFNNDASADPSFRVRPRKDSAAEQVEYEPINGASTEVPHPQLLPIPKNFTYGVGDLQTEAPVSQSLRPYRQRDLVVHGPSKDVLSEGMQSRTQHQSRTTSGESRKPFTDMRRPASSMSGQRTSTSPMKRSQSAFEYRKSHSVERKDNAIYGGSGVRITVNRRAAEVRQLMEEAFGPTKNRGLLTRTKLDYMQYQLHQNTTKNSLVETVPDANTKRAGRSVVGSGAGQAGATTLQDILRLGLDELEKDKRFESLAPKGWTRRRQGRRQPSVHNLLAMKALQEHQEAERAMVRQRVAATSATASSSTSPHHTRATPSLLEVLSGQKNVSRNAALEERCSFVPFSDDIGMLSSPDPHGSVSKHGSYSRVGPNPKDSTHSLTKLQIKPWLELETDADLAASQTLKFRHSTTLNLSRSPSQALLSGVVGDTPSRTPLFSSSLQRRSTGALLPQKVRVHDTPSEQTQMNGEESTRLSSFPSEDTVEVDSVDGSRKRYVIKYTHHRQGRASEVIDVDAAFELFITEFRRPYNNDPEVKARKKANFIANMAKAKELEALDPNVHFGVNKFSDEDLEELHARRRNSFRINTQRVTPSGEQIPFRELNLSTVDTSVAARFKRSHSYAIKGRTFVAAEHRTSMEGSEYALPEEHARAMEAAATEDKIDWRDLGVVSPVKQQGNCGSCWSFATTGNIEALWVISGNNKTLLSEEELLACDVQSGNDACNGGLMQAAFWWILKYRSGYISQAATYPFTSGSGYTAPCNFNKSRPGAYIYDYADIRPRESSIAPVVSQIGPVCVGVDSTSWELYNGGIMSTSCSQRQLDHAVLIVGYDTTFTRPYWIVKNSWGTDWGEQGYLRIAMGSNYCMLADIPSTALVPLGARDLPAVAPTTPEPSQTHALAAHVATLVLVFAAMLLAFL